VALAAAMIAVVSTELARASALTGPILGFTGAPGEVGGDGANCTFSGLGCHESFAVNSGPGMVTIDVPDGYEPGMTYAITVNVAQAGQMRWGFQITVLDALEQMAGSFATLDATTQTQEFAPRLYVTHNSPPTDGTAPGQPNGNSWTFHWTAPDADVGPVTFYAAGNAANNDETSLGDYIYTTTAVSVPEPGGVAAGVCALGAAGLLARRRTTR
jgi:hypothetical protein